MLDRSSNYPRYTNYAVNSRSISAHNTRESNHQSMYERALTREFLNDHQNQISNENPNIHKYRRTQNQANSYGNRDHISGSSYQQTLNSGLSDTAYYNSRLPNQYSYSNKSSLQQETYQDYGNRRGDRPSTDKYVKDYRLSKEPYDNNYQNMVMETPPTKGYLVQRSYKNNTYQGGYSGHQDVPSSDLSESKKSTASNSFIVGQKSSTGGADYSIISPNHEERTTSTHVSSSPYTHYTGSIHADGGSGKAQSSSGTNQYQIQQYQQQQQSSNNYKTSMNEFFDDSFKNNNNNNNNGQFIIHHPDHDATESKRQNKEYQQQSSNPTIPKTYTNHTIYTHKEENRFQTHYPTEVRQYQKYDKEEDAADGWRQKYKDQASLYTNQKGEYTRINMNPSLYNNNISESNQKSKEAMQYIQASLNNFDQKYQKSVSQAYKATEHEHTQPPNKFLNMTEIGELAAQKNSVSNNSSNKKKQIAQKYKPGTIVTNNASAISQHQQQQQQQQYSNLSGQKPKNQQQEVINEMSPLQKHRNPATTASYSDYMNKKNTYQLTSQSSHSPYYTRIEKFEQTKPQSLGKYNKRLENQSTDNFSNLTKALDRHAKQTYKSQTITRNTSTGNEQNANNEEHANNNYGRNTYTTVNTNHYDDRLSTQGGNQNYGVIEQLQPRNSYNTSVPQDVLLRTQTSPIKNPEVAQRGSTSTHNSKNEGKNLSQVKELYSKVINKSPVISSHPIKEKPASPTHDETGSSHQKINLLTVNQSRSKYRFNEETDVVDPSYYEQHNRAMKHSKSAPKINQIQKNLDFKIVTAATEQTPSKEPRRMTYNGVGSPRRSHIDQKNMTSRGTSGDERYSVGKKQFFQSIHDFSKNIVQSTKDLVNRFWTGARTKCNCASFVKTNQETCPRAKKWIFSKYKTSELDYLKNMYDKINHNQEIDPKSKKQISLDIMRTYPENKLFQSSEGLQSLENILQCYAKYDPQIGYVQGMNFIGASVLYHAEEYLAFWILVMIFDKGEMRDIYMHNLPGLAKHSQIIDFLILNNMPQLYSHFCKHGIVVEMFCTEWICGLFGSVISLDKMGSFLDLFIDNGWLFFYKFVLALLNYFAIEISQATDMSEIILIFKNGINKNSNPSPNNNAHRNKINWEELMKNAMSIEVDDDFIYNLHANFDQTSKRFILTKDHSQH